MRTVIAVAAPALIASLLAAPPAPAQTDRPDSEGGRYILREVDDGFLRVDRETGDTSLCRPAAGAWACNVVAEEREALEEEIARLTAENAELARRIAELETDGDATPPSDPEPETPETGRGEQGEQGERDFSLDLPTGEELDAVMDTFETMMRRFLEMVRSLKQDFEENPT